MQIFTQIKIILNFADLRWYICERLCELGVENVYQRMASLFVVLEEDKGKVEENRLEYGKVCLHLCLFFEPSKHAFSLTLICVLLRSLA